MAWKSEALRLPYFGEQAAQVLEGTKHLILISTQPPSRFLPIRINPIAHTRGLRVAHMVERDGDIDGSLEALVDAVEQSNANQRRAHVRPMAGWRADPGTIGVRWLTIFPKTRLWLTRVVPAVQAVRSQPARVLPMTG